MTANCPSSDALVRFARGALAGEAREQVALHLDICESCLEAVAAVSAPTLATGDLPSALMVQQAPQRVHRFTLLELRGRGALGEVHAAYDPELDRRVAIKLLHASTDATRADIIADEARALARVHHGNVATIYDVGRHGDRPYIAMELVEGMTFAQWTSARPRGWAEIRDVIVAACDGLAAAHDAGLIHRDVKPSNVLCPASGGAKLVDFGLARADAIEMRGEVSGTPAYMAPEQWRGEPATARVDQFAVCVMFYEAICGRRPTGEIVARRGQLPLTEIAFPASTPIPSWLRRELERGLRIDPAQRHPSVRALAGALTADRRRRTRGRVALVFAAAFGGAVAWASMRALGPAAETRAHGERLASEARAAAADDRYLYPPVDDPGSRTAFVVVRELEAIDPEAATQLRQAFAEELCDLGDRYWDLPGGRAFATDFYAAARVFDPDSVRAAERAPITSAQLASLVATAARGEWRPAELVAGETLVALAADDDATRAERLRQCTARHGPPPASLAVALEQLIGSTEPQPQAPLAPAPAALPPEGDAPAPTRTQDPPTAPANTEATDGGSPDALLAAATTAWQRGDIERAKTLLHRALGQQPRHAQTLALLAAVHFDESEYDDAFSYAKKAAERAPRSAKIQIQLGDAATKLHRYDDARAAYMRARELGARQADARLARLDRLLGR